ncbi:MAG: hypothetical protein ABIQ95_13920 [Bdellovibrionia bacterium]
MVISKELIQGSLEEGWAAFKVRPWPIIVMMLGLGASAALLKVLTGLIFGEKSGAANIVGILIQFLFMIFYPGFQAYILKAVRREGPDWGDFFWGWKYPVRIFVADILSSLPLLITCLMIVPILILVHGLGLPNPLMYVILGVLGAAAALVLGYFGIRFNQWSLLLIDRNVTALESVKQSWKLMEGQIINFFGLFVILVLINCLGALALLIGVFVSLPVSLGAFAAFYVKISERTKILA